MRRLLIMRHAKSSWDNINLGDHDRPLNERGKADALRMGRLLRDEDLLPDLIISSTAIRARDTAERLAREAGYDVEILFTREFYHADPEDYREVLQQLDSELQTVLIVGHNPGMAELVAELCGVEDRFTTANIAHITLPLRSWQELDENSSGTLHDLWRPKEIG